MANTQFRPPLKPTESVGNFSFEVKSGQCHAFEDFMATAYLEGISLDMDSKK